MEVKVNKNSVQYNKNNVKIKIFIISQVKNPILT